MSGCVTVDVRAHLLSSAPRSVVVKTPQDHVSAAGPGGGSMPGFPALEPTQTWVLDRVHRGNVLCRPGVG